MPKKRATENWAILSHRENSCYWKQFGLFACDRRKFISCIQQHWSYHKGMKSDQGEYQSRHWVHRPYPLAEMVDLGFTNWEMLIETTRGVPVTSSCGFKWFFKWLLWDSKWNCFYRVMKFENLHWNTSLGFSSKMFNVSPLETQEQPPCSTLVTFKVIHICISPDLYNQWSILRCFYT